jgi:putative transposase
MIEKEHDSFSITHQCQLLGVPKSSYYYTVARESEENLMLMKEIDKIYLENPSFGSRLMTADLKLKGFKINRKRVLRLMKIMGIEAIYPKRKIRTTFPGYVKFPYLLENLEIKAKNQVWATDITYIPVNGGYLYLVAFMDLYTRFILSWQLSASLETDFCLKALEMALQYGFPEIVNSDQGSQYTSQAYINLVQNKGSKISMSGKGKCWDNIFVERFWRTLKYEEVHLKQYENYEDTLENINNYINGYNKRRPHSSLDYQTPMSLYLKR